MDFVKLKTEADDSIEDQENSEEGISFSKKERIREIMENDMIEKMDEITNDSCLNILVTSYFLQLNWVYEKVWKYFFS